VMPMTCWECTQPTSIIRSGRQLALRRTDRSPVSRHSSALSGLRQPSRGRCTTRVENRLHRATAPQDQLDWVGISVAPAAGKVCI
jgi:hypothetical protein